VLSRVPFALAAGEVELEDSLQAGIEFEAIIANLSGNNRLSKAIVDVLDELERVLRMASLIAPDTASPPGELEAIFERVRARDADGTHEATRERCERVRRDVLQVLARSASVSRASIEMPPAALPPTMTV
jgi:DNA-binding GntR family transcriptional regulator